MKRYGKSVSMKLINIILLLLHGSHTVVDSSIAKFYLTRDCIYRDDVIGRKGVMEVRVKAAEIYSHRFEYEPYPSNFSCEVHLIADRPQRILVWFNQLYIPDVDPLCENVLHCFNTNTPYSESMAEAGGQTGLCKRTYPKQPLVSTQQYFTFTFRSKPEKLSQAMLRDPEAGFRLTVAAVSLPDVKSLACPGGGGIQQHQQQLHLMQHQQQQPQPPGSDVAPHDAKASLTLLPSSASSATSQMVGLEERRQQKLRMCTFKRATPLLMPLSGIQRDHRRETLKQQQHQPPAPQQHQPLLSDRLAVCLSPEALCDGVVHCPSRADEDPEYCSRETQTAGSGLVSSLLRFGIAASVAIGVAAVAAGMACLLGLACCCYRCLTGQPVCCCCFASSCHPLCRSGRSSTSSSFGPQCHQLNHQQQHHHDQQPLRAVVQTSALLACGSSPKVATAAATLPSHQQQLLQQHLHPHHHHNHNQQQQQTQPLLPSGRLLHSPATIRRPYHHLLASAASGGGSSSASTANGGNSNINHNSASSQSSLSASYSGSYQNFALQKQQLQQQQQMPMSIVARHHQHQQHHPPPHHYHPASHTGGFAVTASTAASCLTPSSSRSAKSARSAASAGLIPHGAAGTNSSQLRYYSGGAGALQSLTLHQHQLLQQPPPPQQLQQLPALQPGSRDRIVYPVQL